MRKRLYETHQVLLCLVYEERSNRDKNLWITWTAAIVDTQCLTH